MGDSSSDHASSCVPSSSSSQPPSSSLAASSSAMRRFSAWNLPFIVESETRGFLLCEDLRGGAGDGWDESDPDPLDGLDWTKNLPLRGGSSSSSSKGGGLSTVVKSPPGVMLAPRLPTRLGTGVGSTRRMERVAEGVEGVFAALTQSLNDDSSTRSLSDPPKDRREKDRDCSDVGVWRDSEEEDRLGWDQWRHARFSSRCPSWTRLAARVMTGVSDGATGGSPFQISPDVSLGSPRVS